MIWNKNLLYQINNVWYHITKLYLVNNEKNYKIKLNHFFYKRRPIDFHYAIYDLTKNLIAFLRNHYADSNLVSFAAVIRVVTQRSSPREVFRDDPNNGCEGD